VVVNPVNHSNVNFAGSRGSMLGAASIAGFAMSTGGTVIAKFGPLFRAGGCARGFSVGSLLRRP
jgi:hypothetical protein